MKRLIKSTAAALTLGLAAFVPSFAKADDRGHFDRNDHRDVRDVRTVREEPRRDEHRDFDRRDVRVHDEQVVVRPEIRDRVIVQPAPVYVTPETDTPIDLCNVPGVVMNTVNGETRGRIESVTLVCRDGKDFYRFIVDNGRGDLDVRIGTNGKLLSVEGC
jgi:hypothetical protein